MDIQYEHNGSFDRSADYAHQTDQADPKKTDDISVDHSFSSDDDPSWSGQSLQSDDVAV